MRLCVICMVCRTVALIFTATTPPTAQKNLTWCIGSKLLCKWLVCSLPFSECFLHFGTWHVVTGADTKYLTYYASSEQCCIVYERFHSTPYVLLVYASDSLWKQRLLVLFSTILPRQIILNFPTCFGKQDGSPHELRKSISKVSEWCGQNKASLPTSYESVEK